MATNITLPPESLSTTWLKPECPCALGCCWFEATEPGDNTCVNRNSLVCRRKCDDIFAPYEKNVTKKQ